MSHSTVTTSGQRGFKEKFRAAIDRKQINLTELARRVSGETYGGELEAARRAIYRHLSGDVKPRREMRRRYETALGLEIGELEPDDEEPHSRMTIDELLTLRVRQILADEARAMSNAPAAHIGVGAAGASTLGGYTDDSDSDGRG